MSKEVQVAPVGEDQVQLLTEKQAAIKKELEEKLTAERIHKLKQVKKRVKMIHKKNKLFFRDKSGSLRRVDKISQNLFDLVMVKFIQQDGESLYSHLKKGVKAWQNLKPIIQEIDRQYQSDFEKVLKETDESTAFTVYYNGSWKPLSRLKLA